MGAIKGHKFKADKKIAPKTMMFHGKSKMCVCGHWSWHPIHDPENWAKKYTEIPSGKALQ